MKHVADADPMMFRVLNEIGIISQLSRAALERATPSGISGAGFNVLNHLSRLPGEWSPARLAAAFQVTKGAMTNTLQRLEAEGCVRVTANPADGRAKHVTLLKKGEKVRAATIAKLGPEMSAIAKSLPQSTLADILPGLAVLRARMDAARD